MTVKEFSQTNTVRYLVNRSHTELRGTKRIILFSNDFFKIELPFDIWFNTCDKPVDYIAGNISFIGGRRVTFSAKDNAPSLDELLKIFEKVVGISRLKMGDFPTDDFFPIYIATPQKIETKNGIGYIYQKKGDYIYIELCRNKILLNRILNNKIFEDSWHFEKYYILTKTIGDVINKIIEIDTGENIAAFYPFIGYKPVFDF